MLLWIGRNFTIPPPPSDGPPQSNVPFAKGPDDHCKFCDSREDLWTCGICGLPICGNHRWGTGSLSDGYYCIAGHDNDPLIVEPMKKVQTYADLTRWQKYKLMAKMDPVLGVMVTVAFICAILAVVLGSIQITLAIMGQPNWPNHH